MSRLLHDPNFAAEYEAQVSKLPTVEESVAKTRGHLAKIDRQLAHENPCQLPPHECEICEDREWHEAHARDGLQ